MPNRIPLIIVPDADEPDAAEVYVQGAVNGQPRRFLLDTGAAKSSIAADALTSTLPLHGEHTSSGVFGEIRDDVVKLDSIMLGPIHRSDFLIARVQNNANRRGDLIGMDLLHAHRCHFQFDRHELEIDG